MTPRLNRIAALLLVMSGAACSKPPEPPADLTFVSFTREGGDQGDHYDLTFMSSIDFYSPDWTAGKRAAMTPRLICTLDDDADFSTKHTLRYSLDGYIQSPGQKSADHEGQFPYTSRVHFRETLNEGQDDQYLRTPELNRLLANRSTIPCKVTRTFYFSLTTSYYSKTMYVPVKALLDAVNG
jgi:hypothetical protein